MKHKTLGLTLGLALILLSGFAANALADPVPAGWTCVGNCGSLGADGVVTLSPIGSSLYQYATTEDGINGVGVLPTGAIGSETNGSTLATSVFSADAGDALNFYFNYITSDGSGYPDYAWAILYDSHDNPTLLFTARTYPSGSIVPGQGMPPVNPGVTLIPATVEIIGGGPTWSPLGGSSGGCWAAGCGYTGWVNANYIIPSADDYYLMIGVVNANDIAFQSGLAMDGVTVGGEPIIPSIIPEPSALILLASGIGGLFILRKKFHK